MKNSTWVALFQWVGLISIILTLVSAIGVWVFSDKVQDEKDKEIGGLRSELIETSKKARELEEKTAPRHITEEQCSIIVNHLSKSQPFPVVVISKMLDGERSEYADQIAAAIQKAGWEVSRNRSSLHNFRGLTAAMIGENSSKEDVAAVVGPLMAAQIPFQPQALNSNQVSGVLNGKVAIVVGRK
jgi:hypothetical protein